MTIPYRTRRFLHNLGIVLLVLVLVGILVWLVWLLWLDRYVIYSEEGAKIDFSASAEYLGGEVALPPEAGETVAIYFNDGENAISTSTELTQLYGYYIDGTTMQERDLAEIRQNVESLPKGSTVMLDVKNGYGEFYYTSSIGPESDAVDISAMDSLIAYLRTSGHYTVARVAAFRDYTYGLNHDEYGLPYIGGGYLWSDDDGVYWLNPDSAGTMNYLINIVAELKGLGFDEVVFTNFCFPDTEDILYEGDRAESLASAASTLVSSCASETFAVSFVTSPGEFTMPTGRSRMYITDVTASQAKNVAEQAGMADPAVYVVFLTDAKDTRYDEFGVLRPITSGNFEEEEE